MPPLISMRGIGRAFGSGASAVNALSDVTLDVAAGEQLAIMGASGSGKSTLMAIIGLLDRPSSGVYRFDGEDTAHWTLDDRATQRCRSIGFIFQQFHLLPQLNAQQNVALPLVYQQVPRAQREQRVAKALADVGLAHRSQHLPSQLSGGERQRVAIARALVARPSLLLADEPTGALDSANGKAVMELMQRLANDTGATLIVITHDPSVARSLRRTVKLHDGRALAAEEPGALAAHP